VPAMFPVCMLYLSIIFVYCRRRLRCTCYVLTTFDLMRCAVQPSHSGAPRQKCACQQNQHAQLPPASDGSGAQPLAVGSVCICLHVLADAGSLDAGIAPGTSIQERHARHGTHMRSCDFSRFAAAMQCIPAAPAALSPSWLGPATCGNRAALRRDNSVARRAWGRYPALLANGPQPHLTFRLTGALGNLHKSLMMDGGTIELEPLERGASSSATASTGCSTFAPTHRSLALMPSSAALSAEGTAPASLHVPAPEACERGCGHLA
jgi:hypothetical protein